MKIRFLVSLIMFIGSYFPLSLILLAQDFSFDLMKSKICWPIDNITCVIPFKNWQLSLPIIVVCLLCLMFTFLALNRVKPKRRINIKEAKYIPAELMAYTLPYVVSFMSLEYQDTGKLLGLLIFLGWMFVITHRSGQLILNPVLIAFGWRLYEITYSYPGNDKEHSAWALSKDYILPDTSRLIEDVQDVMIVKPNTPEENR